MTYHSPGRPRSSSRRAATGSTGSALLLVLGDLRAASSSSRPGLLGGLVVGLVLDVRARLVLVAALDDLAAASAASTSVERPPPRRCRAVLHGLDGLGGVVQVRVRHGGCFFLASRGGTCERGAVTAPSAGSAEDVLDGSLEPIVNHGHETDHDDNEDDHHGGVRRQLAARGPDDLAELRDDLAVEEREPGQGALLAALAAPAGLLLGPPPRPRTTQACRWSPGRPSLVLT